MIRSVLAFGATVIAFLEVVGYETLRSYLWHIGIPFRLANIQLLDLPSWGILTFFSSPVAVTSILGLLLVISYVGYVAKFRSDTVTFRVPPSGKSVDFFTFVLSYITSANNVGRMFRRIVQVLAVSVFCLGSLLHAEQAGSTLANEAMTGHVSNTLPAANARKTYNVVLKPGVKLSPDIEQALHQSKMTLLWQDDRMIYLARINPVVSISGGQQYRWFAVPQDDLRSLTFSMQWEQHPAAGAPAENSKWTNFLVYGVILFAALVLVWTYYNSRANMANLRPITETDMLDLQTLPQFVADNVLAAVQNGRDVAIVRSSPDGQMEKYWLRASTFSTGMRLEAKLARSPFELWSANWRKENTTVAE